MIGQMDESTLKSIMEQYGTELLYLSYTYLKDKSLSEDVVQDTFIRCYNSWGSFRQHSSIRTWLYTITINLCKDHMKSAYRRRIQLTDIIHKLSKNRILSAEDVVLLQENSDEIMEEVLNLPVRYREVIILYYFHDLKVKDIGASLDLSPNTVKTRLRKAKALMKEKVIEFEDE